MSQSDEKTSGASEQDASKQGASEPTRKRRGRPRGMAPGNRIQCKPAVPIQYPPGSLLRPGVFVPVSLRSWVRLQRKQAEGKAAGRKKSTLQRQVVKWADREKLDPRRCKHCGALWDDKRIMAAAGLCAKDQQPGYADEVSAQASAEALRLVEKDRSREEVRRVRRHARKAAKERKELAKGLAELAGDLKEQEDSLL